MPGLRLDRTIYHQPPNNVLYLATYENAACWSCSSKARTLVTTFDISAPAAPRQVDQMAFEAPASAGGFNAAWSTPWKRSCKIAASCREHRLSEVTKIRESLATNGFNDTRRGGPAGMRDTAHTRTLAEWERHLATLEEAGRL